MLNLHFFLLHVIWPHRAFLTRTFLSFLNILQICKFLATFPELGKVFLEEYISLSVLHPRIDLQIQSESLIEELAFQKIQRFAVRFFCWLVGLFLWGFLNLLTNYSW